MSSRSSFPNLEQGLISNITASGTSSILFTSDGIKSMPYSADVDGSTPKPCFRLGKLLNLLFSSSTQRTDLNVVMQEISGFISSKQGLMSLLNCS